MTIVDDEIGPQGLTVASFSFVADPNLAGAVEMEYAVVGCAIPTNGPNRVTLHVPTDTTRLSLGAASPAWKTDLGITGYADSHVHFETKAHDKTVVSLGGPATTTAITGHGDNPPKSTTGYAMVTAERAWHEAKGQHYLLSQTEDISLRTMGSGKRAVIQADQAGYVDINGGQEVNLSSASVAIGAASKIEFEDVVYDGHFSGKSPTSTSAKNAKVGMDMVSALFSVHDLGLKAQKTVKKYRAGELAANEYLYADVVKWIGDSIKFKMSVVKIKKVFAHAASPPGCVKLSAEKNIAGLAGGDVSLSGFTGASMASLGASSIGAGLMATLKGTVFAGVGSILTSLKGQKKIEISSTWGDVVFSAKQNIELTADEQLMAGAVKDAQVTGKKQLLLGAGKRAWIGAEPGWGALFDDKGVAFGKATGAAEMTTASIEASPAIRIDSDKIDIVGTAGGVTLSNDTCLVEAPGIRFDAKEKNVTFNSQQAILVGT